MKTLRYKVLIDKDIKRSLKNFKNDVDKILSHPKSWNVKFIQDDIKYDFKIILTPARKITKVCKFSGLSCADMWNNVIYINNYRWIKGSKASKLPLNQYRIYLINHEVGHILGFGHSKPKKGKKVPVMNQHTLGIYPGLPYCWPLESEQKQLKKMI